MSLGSGAIGPINPSSFLAASVVTATVRPSLLRPWQLRELFCRNQLQRIAISLMDIVGVIHDALSRRLGPSDLTRCFGRAASAGGATNLARRCSYKSSCLAAIEHNSSCLMECIDLFFPPGLDLLFVVAAEGAWSG